MIIPTDTTTLQEWIYSLPVDFPDDNIPVLHGDNWREFGDNLAQEDSFEENGCPVTSGFDDWRSWAKAVFYTMANY